jgi:hypothetical protein
VLVLVAILFGTIRLDASEMISTNSARVLGAADCSSSGCHGGGGRNQNQFLVWSMRDPHSQRSFATLTTARSRQIAEALQIKDPVTDPRCTACHAPLHGLNPLLRAETVQVSEGVSCESCHGPAEKWLRSHTRSDWTRSDRVFAGMRDLKDLYVRANTCVACHQTVELPLLKAGHPELIFELDGQSVAQPKHWREEADGAQAWLVGQAAALREMSWQLSRETELNEKLAARWSALLWLLQKVGGVSSDFPDLAGVSAEPSSQNVRAAWQLSEEFAKRAAAVKWTDAMTRSALQKLAASSDDFQQPTVAIPIQARRAERLVLALERLRLASDKSLAGGSNVSELTRLFQLVQSIPDFVPGEFAAALKEFSVSIPK